MRISRERAAFAGEQKSLCYNDLQFRSFGAVAPSQQRVPRVTACVAGAPQHRLSRRRFHGRAAMGRQNATPGPERMGTREGPKLETRIVGRCERGRAKPCYAGAARKKRGDSWARGLERSAAGAINCARAAATWSDPPTWTNASRRSSRSSRALVSAPRDIRSSNPSEPSASGPDALWPRRRPVTKLGLMSPSAAPRSDPHPVRVVLADDHLVLRQALRALWEQRGLQVVADEPDGQAAVDAVQRHSPDVAVLDVAMPVLNGVDAAREIDAIERSEEHTSELQSRLHLVCRLLLE